MAQKKKTSKTAPKKMLRYKIKRQWHNTNQRREAFLGRRPHRTLRLTRRRDYKRSLKLPSYWVLTSRVFKMLHKNRWLFIRLTLLYALLMLLLASIMSEDTYSQLKQLTTEAHENGLIGGTVATLGVFWGVLTGYVTGNMAGAIGSTQQIIGGIIGLFAWLTTIWLVRALMNHQKPNVRDGLYNAGGPVMALLFLCFVVVLQLIPAAIIVIIYGAADASGLLHNTAALMLAGGATILTVVLSIYWITSTVFAMAIVTLPGMYPMQALRLAGDVVVGRRIRILLRICWALILLLVIWAIILIPIILLDGAIKSAITGLSWLPFVPLVALFLVAFSIIFLATYTYMLYRKVVDDDAAPA